jgi:hypothetical protein
LELLLASTSAAYINIQKNIKFILTSFITRRGLFEDKHFTRYENFKFVHSQGDLFFSHYPLRKSNFSKDVAKTAQIYLSSHIQGADDKLGQTPRTHLKL